jgi:putative DNA primase/helicase
MEIRLAKRIRELGEGGELKRRGFSLVRDLAHVERLLDKHPDTGLICVDPVSAYLGNVDTHRNAEVRSDVLDPLSELAERRGVTVACVTHLNKSVGGSNSLDRVSGSVAFPAAARMVWVFAEDPNQPGRYLMLFGKSNVGPRVPGLAYRIGPDDQGRVTIQWEPGPVTDTIEEVFRAEQDPEKGQKLAQACAIIREVCRNGPAPVSELERRARDMRIGESTLNTARKLLGCKPLKPKFASGWMVALPSKSDDVDIS